MSIVFVGERDFDFVQSSVYQKGTVEDVLNYFKDIKYIQVDTETEGFDPYTKKCITLQLGTKEKQFVIDVISHDIRQFKDLLESTDKTFLFANSKFDMKVLLHNHIDVKNIYDVFLAECVLSTGNLYSTRALSLKKMAKKYCDADLDKEVRGEINYRGLTDRVIKYAAEDVMYMEEIMQAQLRAIEQYGLQEVIDLENKAVRVFAEIEYNGMKIDAVKWKDIDKDVQVRIAAIQQELDNIVITAPELARFKPKGVQLDMFGYQKRILNINYASSKQLVTLLNALKLPKLDIKESDLDAESFDSAGERILLKYKNTSPFVEAILRYKRQKKLSSSFGENFLKYVNPVTQRIHPTFWQIVSTGRVSCKDPNLLQIPSKGDQGKQMRSAFIPEEGYDIVGGDYSGMELRIIAEFSQDPVWVNAFKEGKDLHAVLAASTFEIDISRVRDPFPLKPDMTYREVQKTINFGLSYGMTAYKLSDTLGISIEEAQDIIDRFFQSVPYVREFLQKTGEFAVINGYMRSAKPYRRIRWFPEHEKIRGTIYKARDGRLATGVPGGFKIIGEIERAGKNTPIQGTNADIIKLALVQLKEIKDSYKYPVKIINSIYDEILTECREDFSEEWKHIMDKTMIGAAASVIKTVPIVVDCAITKYWKK